MKFIELMKAFFCRKYDEAVEPLNNRDREVTGEDIQRLRKNLRWIPDFYLYRHVGRYDMHLYMYLLGIKYSKGLKKMMSNGYIGFKRNKILLFQNSPIFIHFLRIENNLLVIEGNISLPKGLEKAYTLEVYSDGHFDNVNFDDTKQFLNEEKFYESKLPFRYERELLRETEFAFYYVFNGGKIRCEKINVYRFSPIANIIEHQYCVLGKWMVYMSNDKLIIKKADERAIEEHEKLFRNALYTYAPDRARWAIDLRQKYFEDRKRVHKPIWLCMDRAMYADDNAKVFFRYIQKYDTVNSYFVISKQSPDYEKMKKIGNVIDIYSEEHYRLTFLAEYMISSQANGVVENPFWENAEMFRDLYHHPKLIFLQHGVIKDDMSLTLNRFNTNFAGFITSTKSERNSILTYPYGYTENEVWLTGLPRFDELYNDDQKYILIMPSWRKGVMKHVWNEKNHDMVWVMTENFEETEYFKHYRSLLTNKILEKLCAKNGFKIAFMPHPLIKPYGTLFTAGSAAELWDENIDYKSAFARGSLLITDYSSVAFDFAYLKKPIIYYQFDAEEFYASHTYRRGYFDYETDGFGEVVNSEEELVNAIRSYVMSDMELKEKYRTRMEKAFGHITESICEKIYRILIGKDN